MSEILYAPPEAEVAVTASDDPDFYVVAPRKFYLLTILTLNLYVIYWFYRNWRLIKLRTGEDIWPPVRGFFFIFFTHALFTDIDIKLKSLKKEFAWSPATTATLVVVLTITSNIMDRLSARNIGSPETDFISTLLVPVVALVLVKAQHAINVACNDPSGSTNSSLTLANWIWMIIGALVWMLLLFGLYLTVVSPELFLE